MNSELTGYLASYRESIEAEEKLSDYLLAESTPQDFLYQLVIKRLIDDYLSHRSNSSEKLINLALGSSKNQYHFMKVFILISKTCNDEKFIKWLQILFLFKIGSIIQTFLNEAFFDHTLLKESCRSLCNLLEITSKYSNFDQDRAISLFITALENVECCSRSHEFLPHLFYYSWLGCGERFLKIFIKEYKGACFDFLRFMNCINFDLLIMNIVHLSSSPIKYLKHFDLAILNKALFQILYIRNLSNSEDIRKIFNSLFLICQSENNLVKETEELGFKALKFWSTPICIQRNSYSKHLSLVIIIRCWIEEFMIPMNSSLEKFTSEILNGTSNHLSCPRDDIRTLGMLLGQWILNKLNYNGISDPDNEFKNLDFKFDRNSKAFRDFHTCSRDMSVTDINQEKTSPEIPVEKLSLIDSDDDSDEDLFVTKKDIEPAMLIAKTSLLHSNKDEWPPNEHKPKYVKECLDAFSFSTPEASSIFLSAIGHAERLFFEHPSQVREFTREISHALLYMNPPGTPFDNKVSESRMKALVATLVIEPIEASHYLLHEFNHSQLSLNMKLDVLQAITVASCKLAGVFQAIDTNGIKNEIHLPSNNVFAQFAGYFFFPLTKSIEKLNQPDDAFKHQDDIVLGKLVACLATIYACARHSPAIERMQEDLLQLGMYLVVNNQEPFVREAALTALGTVLSLYQLTQVSIVSEKISKLIKQCYAILKNVAQDDLQPKCKILAQHAMLAIK